MNRRDLGIFGVSRGAPTVEFERILDAPVDRVWAMLTSEEGLERWLAPASVDLALGGTIDIDFGDGGVAGGEILDLIPGVAIEFRWRFTGEPDSTVRFELEAAEPGTTRLLLRHEMLPTDQAIGYGAGWHAHLDQLEAVSAEHDPIDWDARFAELLPEYQRPSD